MNNARSYQPGRRAARITSGLLGAVIGLGLITSVTEGMGARSGGQSLGQLVATQRAIAAPVAQAQQVQQATPAARPARGAV